MKCKTEKQYKTIRGFRFESGGGVHIPLQELASLYLVLKAFDGDQLAREIMDVFERTTFDNDGKRIYPIEK